ncbi:tripartite tricarboxylate transporter substrate binding protein [Paralcaligenes sp. KSB-10]|uniref:Bug family tripartite tricarboxylate transporter substrate binding protein n=1 Tax=Paralcaligenes sp. KSB-10 TaxID=2901142 RepID=UPI001E421FA7|nr:tripartite tricarboxylate transporter substrate binding protein [Paralcaligenes sp. KSB-10]UHL63050.1 tripartite tricarboxylate transporter substrate binding protein [Paralcaligenes sp. KSB-10]
MAIAMLAAVAPVAQSAGFPSHAVHIVVPYPPGGSADILGRILAQKLQERMGQPFIVENKPGGGSIVGARSVVTAPADGYTLLLGTVSSNAMTPAVNPNARYDPVKDFTPVARVASMPFVLLVRPSLGIKSLSGLIALAKSKPGKLTYSSAGIGTSNHLAGVLLDSQAGIKMTHIPYRGSAPAMNALLSGQVDVMFDLVTTAVPHIKAGTVTALAVSGAKRSAYLPELPTLMEQGLPDYQVTAWFGLFGPAGVPGPVAASLNKEIGIILQEPDVRTQFDKLGITPEPESMAKFAAFVRAESARWTKIVKHSNIAVGG